MLVAASELQQPPPPPCGSAPSRQPCSLQLASPPAPAVEALAFSVHTHWPMAAVAARSLRAAAATACSCGDSTVERFSACTADLRGRSDGLHPAESVAHGPPLLVAASEPQPTPPPLASAPNLQLASPPAPSGFSEPLPAEPDPVESQPLEADAAPDWDPDSSTIEAMSRLFRDGEDTTAEKAVEQACTSFQF